MPSRSYSEIVAEAELALEEADQLTGTLQAKLESTRRVREYVHKIVTTANKRLKECRVLADEARKLAETDRDKADQKYERARERLEETNAFLARLKFVATADPKDEWQECRASIGRFDKLIVSLRKTGFVFVTFLIGAAAYFFPKKLAAAPGGAGSFDINLAVTVSVAGLICALYLIDSAHRKALKTTADRAIELEELLGFRLTQQIKKEHSRVRAFFAGKFFYIVLLFVAIDVFLLSEGRSFDSLGQMLSDSLGQFVDKIAHL